MVFFTISEKALRAHLDALVDVDDGADRVADDEDDDDGEEHHGDLVQKGGHGQ